MDCDAPRTIIAWFLRRVAESGPRPALHVKREGRYQPVTWEQLAAAVYRAAAALVRRGLQPGDRVAQLSENRYEWIVGDLAILLAGGVHVPLHASATGEQAVEQIAHSDARLVLLAHAQHAGKLAACAARLPAAVRCLAYEPCAVSIRGHAVRPWSAQLPPPLSPAEFRTLLQPRVDEVQAATLATILYTSGTTGAPKGVMLSHGNLASNAEAGVAATGESAADLKFCFLPLSHIFGRTSDLYKWIVAGGQLALAESRETVLADCAAVRPTWINGVPYFYERVRRAVIREVRHDDPGGLRDQLGGRIQTCHVGGAPLPPELYEFYWARGVPLFPGYGLTESAPVISLCRPGHVRRDSVGLPLPGVEVRLAADGEILTRGAHVMQGYWKDPAATAAVLRDGWLYTGDLGCQDADGFLYLTGRKKELIITTGGKKIAPAYLESLLTADPAIEQAMVVGDGRDYLVALVVPNPAEWPAGAARGSGGAAPPSDPSPQLVAWYEARVRERLARVSHYEQVQRVALLARPFSVERGEVTPKQSLRRAVIAEHFAAEIERLYARPRGSA